MKNEKRSQAAKLLLLKEFRSAVKLKKQVLITQ